MPKILIGCKLPHGVTLKGSKGQDIVINGMNTTRIVGGFGISYVDESEWAYVTMTYSDFDPILTGAIFTNSTAKVAEIAALGDELADQRTGFEGLNPEDPAHKLKPEDKQAMPNADAAPVRTLSPKSKEDKAAARELEALKEGA